ncbi:MAG: trypsin-like serine protease [Proteobacteria bacterium]|nr:trypsin-like serine protease [Pseudomonadota bacterium]
MRCVPLIIVFISLTMVSCGIESTSQLNVIGPDSLPQASGYLQTTATVKILITNDDAQAECDGVYIQRGVVLTAYHCVSSEVYHYEILLDVPTAFRNDQIKAFDVEKVYQVGSSDVAVLIFNEGLTDSEMAESDFPKPLPMATTYPDKALDVWAEGRGGSEELYSKKIPKIDHKEEGSEDIYGDENNYFRQAALTLYSLQHLDQLEKNNTFRNTIISLPWWYKLHPSLKNNYFSRFPKRIKRFFEKQDHKDVGITVPRLTKQTEDTKTPSKTVSHVDSEIKSSMICSGDSGAPLYTDVDGHIQVMGIIIGGLVVHSSVGMGIKRHGEIKPLNVFERHIPLLKNRILICSNVSFVYILPYLASDIRDIINKHFAMLNLLGLPQK